ncbi:MAG TPA: ABC-type transport auxiliary lipoprotein family protein [Candidatus Acidoferrales bacterium]|nr:ABC-type transport auxiliary lipoprotein family protein [Candidatus Acidoferrales bacterium]
MRIKHAMLLIITLAISAALTSCVGSVRYPTYYALHLPPAPDAPIASVAHASVAIREFRSPDYLRKGPLVYRASPEQIGFYDYHRWAADPREFVTSAITDRLRSTGSFADLKIYDGRSPVDYILSGRLEKLEEVDYDGGIKVEVALSAQMTEVRTGAQVWANSATEIVKVDQRNVPAVVSEMSNAMGRAIDKLLASFPTSELASSRQ